MPSLHNAFALKAAPQASVMAQRTAQHTWERHQAMVSRTGKKLLLGDELMGHLYCRQHPAQKEHAAAYLSAVHLRVEWKQ